MLESSHLLYQEVKQKAIAICRKLIISTKKKYLITIKRDMKQYKLIALSEAGMSAEYSGESIEEVKRQFSNEHAEVKEFTARIYDHFSGALLEVKPLGMVTYGKA